jgi:hypothetical protein
MEDLAQGTSQIDFVPASLEGGPASIPKTSRVQQISPADRKIKILHHGGYEHFERVDAPDGHASLQEIVFRWTMRTEIAE